MIYSFNNHYKAHIELGIYIFRKHSVCHDITLLHYRYHLIMEINGGYMMNPRDAAVFRG